MINTTEHEINEVMEKAWAAFHVYRKMSLTQRASFMRSIGEEIAKLGDALITIAMQETNLPEARLIGERNRTIFQLNSYAEACERGQWLDARIDTAIPSKVPPKPDIRKMLIPLGPVVVFGASNFPFAYSTAGGDTACAFAAGCPVIVKGHPAHIKTSELIATAILKAADAHGMPQGIFAHISAEGNDVGEYLVKHPYTKAVGFTGSFSGGKQLFDWGNQRKEPIPVFAEMGSVNPVFFLPGKLKTSAAEMAKQFAASITLGAGQFCTNPGIMVGIKSDALNYFISLLTEEIKIVKPARMLHEGIHKNYADKRENALSQKDVETVVVSEMNAEFGEGLPTISSTTAKNFIKNNLLHQEVFGPYSILVICDDKEEMLQVATSLEGQLTITMMADEHDFSENEILVESLKNICGRFIFNSVPTGVEVCTSMHHGGPFPATTDSRFTSVGADGIKRFARPIAFQNWPDLSLPDELKNENPLKIYRTVNDELTTEKVNIQDA